MLCPFACQLDNETVAGKLMNKMFQLIATLEEAQGGGGGAQLDEESLAVLRDKTLHASGDHSTVADDPSVDRLANRICGSAVSIATEISQLGFFRGAFMLVIDGIAKQAIQIAASSKGKN